MKLRTDLLENQIQHAHRSVELVSRAIAAYHRDDRTRVNELKRLISAENIEVDAIKETAQLHWSTIESDFRTKFAALDLIARISLIADYTEDIAVLLLMRTGSTPDAIWPTLNDFITAVLDSVEELQRAISMARGRKKKSCGECPHFVRMYPGAAMGRCRLMDGDQFVPGLRDENSSCEVEEKEEVYKQCEAVSAAEATADRLERTLRGTIYREEIDLATMAAMHLLKIVENCDMIANIAEECATSLKAMY